MPSKCFYRDTESFPEITPKIAAAAHESREPELSRKEYANLNEVGFAANEAFEAHMRRLEEAYKPMLAQYEDLPDSVGAYLKERGGNVVRTEALLELEAPAHELRAAGFASAPEVTDLLAIHMVSGYTERATLLEDTQKLCKLAEVYGLSWQQVWSDMRARGLRLQDIDAIAEQYCAAWAEKVVEAGASAFDTPEALVAYVKEKKLLYEADTSFITEPPLAEAA